MKNPIHPGDTRFQASILHTSPSAHADSPLWRKLAPLCLLVFMEFLAMGIPLPVLPSHVHQNLGMGMFAVGVVIGLQSWATLVTRHAAGKHSDQNGPRSSVFMGLFLSSLAGLLYAASSPFTNTGLAFGLLLLGRMVLGAGESLVITGALSWGIALAGREHTGKVMSWLGIAMYGAIAIGSPVGTWLDSRLGFVGMSFLAAVSPLLGLLPLGLVPDIKTASGQRLRFGRVLGMIWLPGAGLALSALGFGAIAAFSTLRFQQQGWSHASFAMTTFGATYVLARIVLGSFPDRFGGARIAMFSSAVIAVGQFAMGMATSGTVAVAAAGLTGLGFSLAFPAFGVEAIRRVPPQNRGAALGAYSACFDLTLGIGVPLLGILLGYVGYWAAYAIGGCSALLSFLIALFLFNSKSSESP
jgi:MFS family permease